MKKFLTLFSAVAMFVIVLAPTTALAAASGIVLPSAPAAPGPALTGSGIVKIITDGVNYLITIAVVVAVAMFIYGGVQYATGGAAKGKEILTNAAIGLLAILGVGLLINTIARLVAGGLDLG